MKLYDYARSPNARRVRMFLAEKTIELPVETVDLAAAKATPRRSWQRTRWAKFRCSSLTTAPILPNRSPSAGISRRRNPVRHSSAPRPVVG